MPFRRSQLEYFVAVAEDGQITSAARRLHLAQPALSQAMAQLETELGVKLFDRHARGVTLTAAGEVFYEKARLAVAAAGEAAETARWLARAQQRRIEFGFLGAAPGLDSPALLAAFARAHPDIELRFRELPFPSHPTGAWLSEVDIAVCHLPRAERGVWTQVLRSEPRSVLAPVGHPLASHEQLTVAEVLDELYIGFNPSVESDWAGFWSLDDHRGGPPAAITDDRVTNPQEVLAALAVRKAITTVPASVAAMVASTITAVAAIPLSDCAPSTIAFVGRDDRNDPLVAALLAFARDHVPEQGGPSPVRR